MAVAAAFVIGSYLLLPVNLYLQHRYAGISIFDHLWQLRWVALCTAIMAAAVLAVRFALVGHVQAWVLLAIEVIVGVVVYRAALFIFERALFREVAHRCAQAMPGGDRVARLLGIQSPMRAPRRRRRDRAGSGNRPSRRRAKSTMGMDIAADLGVDEARTADI